MKPTSSPTPPADDLAAETSGPIPEGLATWRGTAVPTKGGVSVRGVVLDRAAFAKLLSANAADGVPGEPDWYLGAVVRVRGVVERHVDEPSPEEAALHAQRRAGAWLSATRLESVELVQAAQVVEGELLQSKGFFQVGQALVTPRDIRWALGSAHVGDRVRLWGQLHVQVCDPRAQCLLGGSLPIFEVGRAKKID